METNISPGALTGMTIVPKNSRVQLKGTHTITFTTVHVLEMDSMIEVRMPALLTLPLLDSSMTV